MISFLAFAAFALFYGVVFVMEGNASVLAACLMMSLLAGRELIYRRDDRIRRGG